MSDFDGNDGEKVGHLARLSQILELFECAVLLAQSAGSFEDETKRNVEVGPTHPAALNEVLEQARRARVISNHLSWRSIATPPRRP